MEEAIRDSDIINTATSVGDKESLFPYIDEKWIKEGALICMPSAARFDEEFYLDENTKLVVDNYKLYEAWADDIHILVMTRYRWSEQNLWICCMTKR